MGFKWFSTGSSYETNPINPNPYRFIIKSVKRFPRCYVSEIIYPNCVNFEGNKILVTTYDPSSRTSIDPHFYSGSGLIARFEPTQNGLELAYRLAESM